MFDIIFNEAQKQYDYIVDGCLVATQFVYGNTFVIWSLSNGNEINIVI